MRNAWIVGVVIACLFASTPLSAEDGYDLWLRYRPLPPAIAASVRARAATIVTQDADPRITSAQAELIRAVKGLAGTAPTPAAAIRPGAILLGTPKGSPLVRQLGLSLAGLGREGYVVRRVAIGGVPVIVVAANDGAGVLYGTFALIERLQRGEPVDHIALQSRPRVSLRVLNHWDNLDRQVERGYAGQSIWDWWRLPGQTDVRYTDYARANASIGINGTVLNNVNAKADSLTAPYIAKAAAVADTLRPWGMKVYLSARFSAPIELGGLKTADPLDPVVARW